MINLELIYTSSFSNMLGGKKKMWERARLGRWSSLIYEQQ